VNAIRAWLEAQWNQVPAKYRRVLVIGLVGIVVVAALYLFVSRTPEKKTTRKPELSRHIFGHKDFEGMFGLSGVSQELDRMRMENKKLRDELNRLRDKPQGLPPEIGNLQAELRRMQEEVAKLKQQPPPPVKDSPTRAEPPGRETRETLPWLSEKADGAGGELDWSRLQAGPETASPGKPELPAGAATAGDIKVITGKSPGRVQSVKEKQEKATATFLPAGSIFSGTLITGMDVSCSQSAKRDPFPVLLRVKKEAILPNRFRADVRECFLIAAGWGDMSSERAYLRGERLSCIREDGKALENRIDMYAVGEDGKAGVRGRLVSKTGALLGKALLAGFIQGFSELFSDQPVLTISTRAQDKTPFQSNMSREALESAGLEGVGSALDRLANYYIDMAQNIFPVIEIDAGRAIDFVLISGISLKLEGKR